MSTQQAPHTPPLWRKFLSLPHTRLGWWAIGLGVPSLVLIAFLQVSEVLGWTFQTESVGAAIWLTVLLVGLVGGVVGLIAVGAHDRALLVWVAQVPMLMIFAFLVWAVSSMSIGHDANVWVTAPFAVLLWAVFVFNIMWVTRKSGES